MGKVGEVRVNWQFLLKVTKIYLSTNINFCTIALRHNVEALSSIRFKIHQCILVIDLSNLMLARVSH